LTKFDIAGHWSVAEVWPGGV